MKYDENGYYGNKRMDDNIDNITALHALFDNIKFEHVHQVLYHDSKLVTLQHG